MFFPPFLLSFLACVVYVCICTCVLCVRVSVITNVCRLEDDIRVFSFIILHLILLRQGLSLYPEFALFWVGWSASPGNAPTADGRVTAVQGYPSSWILDIQPQALILCSKCSYSLGALLSPSLFFFITVISFSAIS